MKPANEENSSGSKMTATYVKPYHRHGLHAHSTSWADRGGGGTRGGGGGANRSPPGLLDAVDQEEDRMDQDKKPTGADDSTLVPSACEAEWIGHSGTRPN